MPKDIESRTDTTTTANGRPRREWTKPIMVRLIAGKAENGAGPVADDPVDFS